MSNIPPSFTLVIWEKFIYINNVNWLNLLALELAHVQMTEETTLIEQLLVGALLDDLPLVDHDHIIGVANGT